MSDSEFDEVAAEQADQAATSSDVDDRIVDACRGSANPSSLAWIAEATCIRRGTRVVDLGSGLAGPAAWIARHYTDRVVAVEPAAGAVRGAARLFDIPLVRAGAERAPFAADTFDVALLLGVLSVVDDPTAAAREAGRVARRVGVLDYRASGGVPRSVGGSRFPDRASLEAWLVDAGLTPASIVDARTPPPPSWERTDDALDEREHPEAARAERAVADAIDAGLLSPVLAVAERA